MRQLLFNKGIHWKKKTAMSSTSIKKLKMIDAADLLVVLYDV